MATHKAMDRICVVAVILSLLLTVLFMKGEALGLQPAGKAIGYEARLFDTSRVHTIDIVMDNWASFLETCQSEQYSPCSMLIDGESYKNVGIRGKGNTSLRTVSTMDSSRYSFKIEFDQYDSAKSYYGLDKLSLNNLIQDNTMMKDYLAYQMMNAFGAVSPLCSFVYITVNGEPWGLYLAVEGIEEAFLQRNYGKEYGELYKPDSMSFGGGRGNGQQFDIDHVPNSPDTENAGASNQPNQRPDFGSGAPPAMPEGSQGAVEGSGFHSGSAADVKLQYIDDHPDSYQNIFDNAKTDLSQADKARLIASLKSLSSFENLEHVLDIEAVLRYFVVHNFVVNGDSYTGDMIHNYYLYEKDGRLSMIPWDYNLAFGTFQGNTATASVNSALDDVLSDRPMQAWMFSQEAYIQQYHRLYTQFLNTVDAEQIIDDAYTLIADYVQKDPTKFCTYAAFETGVEALKTFCSLRRESVQGQLAGTIPSTSTQQASNWESLVNADDLKLSDLGTMDHGTDPGDSGAVPGMGDGVRQPNQGQPPADVSSESGERGAFPWEQDGQVTAEASTPADAPRGAGFSPPAGNDGGFTPPGSPASSNSPLLTIILLGVSILALAAGLLIAGKFKR